MLFDKNFEKDNCGYGLICNRNGKPSRKIVEKSIDALSSMAHRGGVGFDGKTGDGSGLLFDICLLYTSPSPRDSSKSRMPSSA